MVYIDGLAHNTGGTAAFRDITRCKYFAKEIETTGQTWATERLYKYNQKIEAYCVPKFLLKDTKLVCQGVDVTAEGRFPVIDVWTHDGNKITSCDFLFGQMGEE